MANRIQPHPNPPYLKSDGTLNASGQLKLYIAGTATPKVAYKDAAGTSYGSTIDLDASGLPDEGPIYWDNEQLYKVEVYYPDGVGGYTLDYTVDSFGTGGGSSLATYTIEEATVWTVDGVGATAITFSTITEAFVEARKYQIIGEGTLTIFVNNGTYTDDIPDLSHPDGAKLHLEGQSKAGTILLRTTVSAGSIQYPTLELTNGNSFGSITNMTLQHADGNLGVILLVTDNSRLLALDEVELENTAGATGFSTGLTINGNSTVIYDSFSCTGGGVQVSVSQNSTLTTSNYTDGVIACTDQGTTAIQVSNGGLAYLYDYTIDGQNKASTFGIYCSTAGRLITSGTSSTIHDCDIGVKALYLAEIAFLSAPTITSSATADYQPALKTILSTTPGSADTAIIFNVA